MQVPRNIATITVVCSAIIIAGLTILLISTKEPTYNGRTLSSWLEDIHEWNDDPPAPVTVAITTIGTNNLEVLVDLAITRPSRWAKELEKLSKKIKWAKLGNPETYRYEHMLAAQNALGKLGSYSTNALPILLSAMRNDREKNTYWGDGLAEIMIADPNIIPTVLEVVKEPRHRSSLCNLIGIYRIAPEITVPYLKIQVLDSDPRVRQNAQKALRIFGIEETTPELEEETAQVE